MRFWRSRNGIDRVRVALRRGCKLIYLDSIIIVAKLRMKISRFLGIKTESTSFSKIEIDISARISDNMFKQSRPEMLKADKPVIFVSVCTDDKQTGGYKYNGGIKELNYLVKLLRRHGYEAYMVTYDGFYEPWLVEHQPHISIAEFQKRLKTEKNVRCLTSWIMSDAFINECDVLYFWDMELAYSEHRQFGKIYALLKSKRLRIAGCNSMICSWHMAHWAISCTRLLDWIDEDIWHHDDAKRVSNRIGYMIESENTAAEVCQIREILERHGLNIDFHLVSGDERTCLEQMQTCNLFIGLNHGKDLLWGEGFGLPMMEAMWAGCVVVAYDIMGNRDFIYHGFNGLLVNRSQPLQIAQKIISLFNKEGEMARLRTNSLNVLNSCHTSEARWTAVEEFLELN